MRTAGHDRVDGRVPVRGDRPVRRRVLVGLRGTGETIREHLGAIALVAAGIIVIFTPLGETLVPNPILRAVFGLCCWVAPFVVNKLTDKQAD